MKFLIWSIEHRGWWGPDKFCYCRHRKDAGRYSFEEASEIVNKANYAPECVDRPNEAMIPDFDYAAHEPPSVTVASLDLPAMPESPNVSPTQDR